MNKTLASLIISAMCLTGCSSIPTQSQLAKKIKPDYQKWEQKNQNRPKTLEEIQLMQRKDIIYAREEKETWMGPEQALTLGYGDCEEKAFAGAYFAGFLGYKRQIIAVAEALAKPGAPNQPRGHALTFLEITTGSGKKKYGLVDENILFYPAYESINELMNDVNKTRRKQGRKWMFNYWKVVDLDQEYRDTWVDSKNFWKKEVQFGNYTKVN